MADRNKFEEMLERLVNEDRNGAEELFHEIVVEASRDIYEQLLSEEADEEVDEATDEEVDESEEDLDESEDDDLEESDDEDLDESEDDLEEGFFGEGDPADELGMDVEMPAGDMDMDMDMGDEEGADDMGMGDEGEVEDRVADLEDELEALKAEFEAMMGDEAGDEDDMDMGDEMPMDMDSEEGDDDEEAEEESYAFEAEDEDDDEIEESRAAKSNTEMMREYADKVAPAKMGDNGANAKSTVAGKNDMGGTTANIAKAGTENGPVEANKGNLKGSALSDQNPKDMNTKNVNVPGAKGATKLASQPGHGAEKKGKPESSDKGAGSPLNGAPKRAK